MKRGIVIIVLLAELFIPGLIQGADWRLYCEEKDPLSPLSEYPEFSRHLIDESRFQAGSRTPYYCDMSSVVRIGSVVRAWTKTIMIPKKYDSLQLFSHPFFDRASSLGETAMRLFMSTFATEEILFCNEINCAERSYRKLNVRELDRRGYVVIGSMKPDLELKFIEPDSKMEKLYNLLCK